MNPRQATTEKRQYKLRTDNHDVRGGWLLLNGGDVILTNQRHGEEPTGKVIFTAREFRALVDWYNRDQKRTSR